jgi:LysR family transcriptional regulator, mexEF-oprN operon transcriptional activator
VRGVHVCLFDPRKVRIGAAIDEKTYFAHQHVVVSYNGDLRGVVEDLLRKTRDVRCSVSGFAYVGKIVAGTSLLATVPNVVADYARRSFPHLRTAKLPFEMSGSALELLWLATTDDDPALRFLRDAIERVSWTLSSPSARKRTARASRR